MMLNFVHLWLVSGFARVDSRRLFGDRSERQSHIIDVSRWAFVQWLGFEKFAAQTSSATTDEHELFFGNF